MMRARLTLVVIAWSLIAAVEPDPDIGTVGWQLQPNLSWQLVGGWMGKLKITQAGLTVKSGNQVFIDWTIEVESVKRTYGSIYQYESDPKSNQESLKRGGKIVGVVKPMGNRLKIEIKGTFFISTSYGDESGVFFLLRQEH
jgi:hypothetical protein